jgi:Ca-activated chloride channel family protein
VPRAALWFPQAVASAAEETREDARRAPWRHALLAAIWLCLVAAACGPRWLGDEVRLSQSGRDLMLAVDISESMRIEDMQWGDEFVGRLSAVKHVAGEFLRRREGDRIGLILFGSGAFLQAPLSFDRATVGRLLEEARIGFAGKQTAIGDALAIAVKRLRERPEKSRVLILLTDGANTAGSIPPREAAGLAAAAGLRVYTIGIGAEELEVPGPFGGMFGSRRVNPSADLDEATLTAIAEATGGRYFRARDPRELEAVYREIDTLEPVVQDPETRRPMVSLAHWPLAAALLGSLALAVAIAAPLPRRAPGRARPRATEPAP